MIPLTDTNDKLQLVTSSAANVDVIASLIDVTTGGIGTIKKQRTTIASATTTDIVDAPSGTDVRAVKAINIRNRHATLACDVTVVLDDNGTDYEFFKASLDPGEVLSYLEGVGWFQYENVGKLDKRLYVDADYVNATTSFSDITGLTCPVVSGRNYCFEATLFHFANAITTGPRFAINGPAMTGMRLGTIITESGGVAAAVMNGNVGDVTALDTAVAATTDSTTTMVMSIMSGWLNPSADGTFAVRGASEVAVAAGLTVKKGSWCRIWEVPN